jgi:hypothetical protein
MCHPDRVYRPMKTTEELQREIDARDLLLDRMTGQLGKALDKMVFWQNRAKELEREFALKCDDE